MSVSQTRRLFFLNKPPGHDRHTFSTHSFIPVSSIHPFGWQCTRTPGGKFSFGKVFSLKITMGFSLVPSAMHASTTVNPRFLMSSCVDQHSFRTFLIHGSGRWHVKPHRRFVHVPDVNKFVIFLLLLITKLWKLVIFWSRCSGGFWAIFVFCLRARFFRRKNLVHQQLEARNPVICNSEAIAFALMLIMLQVTMYPLCLCSSIHWRSLSSHSGHWHGLPRLLHLFFGMHFSFSISFHQSRTNFLLTQNSRPVGQFDSCVNLTTCNLNLAEHFIRFEDIFLNLETGEKLCGRDLVNNNPHWARKTPKTPESVITFWDFIQLF